MIDFTADTVTSNYNLGKTGEHNASQLTITPPAELSGDERTDHYRVAFYSAGKTYLSASKTGASFTVKLSSEVTQSPNLSLQIIAYDDDGEFIGKSKIIKGFKFDESVAGASVEISGENDDIAYEIVNLNDSVDTLEAYLTAEIARATAKDNQLSSDKVDKVTGKGLSTNDYTNEEKNKLSAQNIFYGTCSTNANQATKIVSADSSFTLKNGVYLIVSFQSASGGGMMAPRYLNVNNSGVYPIRCYNSSALDEFIPFNANSVITFLYENEKWLEINCFKADNGNFGFVKLSDSLNSNYDNSYGYAATPKAIYELNNTKQNKSDKVISISASSTDNQYPSAKAVYDLIGDVSSAIASINALVGGASS